jgi:hypothetical protein
MTEELSDEALLNAIRGNVPMTNNQASALMERMSGSNIIYHLQQNRETIPNIVLSNYFAGNFSREEIALVIDLSPKWIDKDNPSDESKRFSEKINKAREDGVMYLRKIYK